MKNFTVAQAWSLLKEKESNRTCGRAALKDLKCLAVLSHAAPEAWEGVKVGQRTEVLTSISGVKNKESHSCALGKATNDIRKSCLGTLEKGEEKDYRLLPPEEMRQSISSSYFQPKSHRKKYQC